MKAINEPVGKIIIDQCSTTDYIDKDIKSWDTLFAADDINDIHTPPQYKRSLTHYYVYCFPSTISFGSQTVNCSSKIYKIPLEIDWKTNDRNWSMTFKQKNFTIGRELISDDIHIKEAEFMNDTISEHIFRMSLQKAWQTTEQMKTKWDNSINIEWYSPSWWLVLVSTILSVILLLLLLLLFCCRTTKNKQPAINITNMSPSEPSTMSTISSRRYSNTAQLIAGQNRKKLVEDLEMIELN